MPFKINEFGDRLKEAREKMNISRASMAQKLNMTTQAYGAYEIGKREPPISKLIEICDFLQVSPHTLLGYTPGITNDFEEAAHLCESLGIKITKNSEGKGLAAITPNPNSFLFEIDTEDDLILIVKNAHNEMKTEYYYQMLKNKILAESIENELFTYSAERNGWPIVKYPQKDK